VVFVTSFLEMGEGITRREFLVRFGSAAAASALVAGVGRTLYRPPSTRPGGEATSFSVRDFSVGPEINGISIMTGSDRARTFSGAVEGLGGIGRFIEKGDRVVIKVNAAFAAPPAVGATTHPELVAEVVRLCYRAGAERVVVTDNPINDPYACFQLTGIGRAAESAGARVVLPKPEFFRPVTLAGERLIRAWPVLFDPLREATKLIGVAPVKDHHRSGASMTMKNWYGLLGGRWNVFHQQIHAIIAELAALVRPTFVVLDGTVTMVSNGPTGGSIDDLRPTNTMIVSTDQVAADTAGAALLGRPLSALPFITQAAAAGLGTTDLESLKPFRDRVL